METEKAERYSISVAEQETVIQISRDEKVAHIWTCDTTVMTKLDKIYEVTDVAYVDGAVYSKRYECPKEFVSFRSKRREYKNGYVPSIAQKPEIQTEIDEAI